MGGADTGGNMWLLQASYNGSVGSRIASNMRTDLTAIVNQAKNLAADKRPQSMDEVRTRGNITVTRVVEGSNFLSTPPKFWIREQIRDGVHIDGLRLLNDADLVGAGIRLRPGQQPTQVKVFPSPAGGIAKTLQLGTNGTVRRPADGELFKGIVVNSGTYMGGQPLHAPESDLMNLNVTVLKTRRTEATR